MKNELVNGAAGASSRVRPSSENSRRWKLRRRLGVTAIVSVSPGNVFRPRSLINGPALRYRPSCARTLFRSPTGSLRVARHMSPSCYSRLISGGLADIKQRYGVSGLIPLLLARKSEPRMS